MKLLIAYDGSSCAREALDDLRWAGLPGEAEAIAVSIAEEWLPPPPPSSFEVFEMGLTENDSETTGVDASESGPAGSAHTTALEARDLILSVLPGWKVSAESYSGSPASAILARADEWCPDLIVVGSHGRSAMARLVLGSVSQKIVTEARGSVRVARSTH